MKNQETFDRTKRLVKAATGEELGDGEMVKDFGVGIIEPGYSDPEVIWVMGNWNPKSFDRDRKLTNRESRPVRLGNALDKIGAETLWLDEWIRCEECGMAVRSQPDSYHWQPYWATVDDAKVCVSCITANMDEDILESLNVLNNSKMAVYSWITDKHLEEWGFSKFGRIYENGFHPGQDDSPEKIFASLNGGEDCDVVFRIDEASQFYMRFTAWIRPIQNDDTEVGE